MEANGVPNDIHTDESGDSEMFYSDEDQEAEVSSGMAVQPELRRSEIMEMKIILERLKKRLFKVQMPILI